MVITAAFRDQFQSALIGWFETAQRDLPWRRTKDPYAIVVSEFMLQQTQVSKVIPYFERFMREFPTVEALANASEEEVLRVWSGLGYYRRAHHLLALSREVVKTFQGTFPREKNLLLSLPGIGPYTAGAILSIAFGIPCPLVDGNVERVLSRVFGCKKDLASSEGRKALWSIAEKLVPDADAGIYNQALMELGATICLPNQPTCLVCPVHSFCKAFQEGNQTHFPVKNHSSRTVQLSELVLLVEKNGSWLLISTNQENLYPGLWQFPWIWIDDPDEKVLQQKLQELARIYGLKNPRWREVHRLKHGVTYRTISTIFYRTQVPGGHLEGSVYRWVETKDLANEALPSYQKKVLRFLD